MAQAPRVPSESELQAFTKKLQEFGATLPPHEQELLHVMVQAAGSSGADVQAYSAHLDWLKHVVEYWGKGMGGTDGGLNVYEHDAVIATLAHTQDPDL